MYKHIHQWGCVIIRSITLENIRCFTSKRFDFTSNFVVLQGDNGSGKTSVLESLHYACYLRSFRTRNARDLIREGEEHCFLAIDFYQPCFALEEKINVGFSRDNKKIIRLNGELVHGYKELLDHYRVVTLTADDLSLVSGEPEERRSFMNAAILLENPGHATVFREYARILELRNAYLHGQAQREQQPSDEFKAWTELFWQHTAQIQALRRIYLAKVEAALQVLLVMHLSDIKYKVTLAPHEKLSCSTVGGFAAFWEKYVAETFAKERHWQRSLFGAHLDDFSILLDGRKARLFASRGQQKLIAYLIKIVQVQESINIGNPAVFLVDDFLTDFDRERAQSCLSIIRQLATQVILTIPLEYSRIFDDAQAQIIAL